MKQETKFDTVAAVALTAILMALFFLSSMIPKTIIWIILYLTALAAFGLPWIVIVSRPLSALLEKRLK